MDIGSFSSFFNETILDNNGIPVSDVNKGIKNIYDKIIIPSDKSKYEMFIITEEDQYKPDLVAYKYFNDQNLWYYFLFTNAIEDPFTELTIGWAYGVVDTTNAEQAIDLTDTNELKETSRIGSVITLN